ncbi:hypothetical protein FB451DRAFT_1164426 [Mycena latifolia]|nr:hypothetical protein FB451DRAFT_1164426 [Mycena latifolia]
MKWILGDYRALRVDAREAQRLAQESGNWYQESQALQIEASITLLNRGRELLKLCGLSGGSLASDITGCQAQIHLLKSEYGRARRIHAHVLMIGASDHDVLQTLNKAKAVFKNRDLPREIICCETILADLYLRDRNTLAAKALFQELISLSWRKNAETVSYCLERLGDTGRWEVSDFNWSYRQTIVYLAHAQTTQEKLDLHKALQFLGDVFLHNGDEETAHSLFIVALDGFTYMDVHRSRANCMLRLGDMAQQRGELVEAVELWRSARPLFELSLQTKDVAQVDARLGDVDQVNQKALAQLTALNVPTELSETLSFVEETEAEEEGKPIEVDRKQDMSLVTV